MIVFEAIRFRNFLSTGDAWTEIYLNKSTDTLVIGENGAGKSTMLDALCFVLFGKGFRKINRPQLVNSVNPRPMEVELDFSIGKTKYLIKRGMKPDRFEIYVNDNMIDQTASVRDYQEILESIIGINYNSFTQIVILGSSAFVPFMQLQTHQRREIIEDLLDINIFSVMNHLLKERTQENREGLRDLKHLTELEEEKRSVHEQYIEELKNTNQQRLKAIKKEIDKSEATITRLMLANEKDQELVDHLTGQIKDKTDIDKKIQKLYVYESKFEEKIKNFKKRIKFYEENDDCPTCKQDLPEEIKTRNVDESTTKMLEVTAAMEQLNSEVEQLNERLGEVSEVQGKITEAMTRVADNNNQASSLNKYIEKISADMEKENVDNHDLKEENAKIKDINKLIRRYEKKKEKLSHEKELLMVAAELLKDKGIKTQIVKKYIPIMNKLVNKYLAAMEFFVSFELDENFNETIRSRHRDDFSYASFSEGEKMRIDLALLLTWRAIAKMKNSTNTNLLVLDEVFDASLDNNGCDEFLKLLKELSKNTNVFVISHKGDVLQDKFRSVIKFEKHKGWSRIAA